MDKILLVFLLAQKEKEENNIKLFAIKIKASQKPKSNFSTT